MLTLRHLPIVAVAATLLGTGCSKTPPPPREDASYKAEQIQQLSALLRCTLASGVVSDSCPPDSSVHAVYVLDDVAGNAPPFASRQAADSALRQLVGQADKKYGTGWACPDSSRMWGGQNRRLRVKVLAIPTDPPGWNLDVSVVPGPAKVGSCS